jgi:hypothetical protein
VTVTALLAHHVTDCMATNNQEWLAAYLSSFQSNKTCARGKKRRKLLDLFEHVGNGEHCG